MVFLVLRSLLLDKTSLSDRVCYNRSMNKLLAAQLVRAIFAILILLLVARLIFLAIGVDPSSPIVGLLLAASNPLTLPFRFLFKPLPPLGFAGIDYAALVALLVVMLLAWLAAKLLRGGEQVS